MTSRTLNCPLPISRMAMPDSSPWRFRATRRLSWRSSRSASSLIVPGVRIRTTLRSTGPWRWRVSDLFADGHGRSQAHQFGQVTFHGMIRMPAMGIGSPADCPRLVRVISSRWRLLWRHRKTAHRSPPSGRTPGVPGSAA